ncbi:GGDEF domain-containing protein [Geodermatophilus sp. SYSU D00698]
MPSRSAAGRPAPWRGGAVVAAWGQRTGTRRPVVWLTAALVAVYLTGVDRARSGPAETLLYDVVLYNAVPVLAGLLCWRTGGRSPAERRTWQAVAVAWGLIVVGNLTYVLVVVPQAQPPFPSVADAWWLAAYPPLFAVPLFLVRSRAPRASAVSWLDGLIGALAVAAVTATWVLAPTLSSPAHDPLAVAANLAYPVADLLLLALVGAVFAVLGARVDRAVLLLCAVLTGKLVADVLIAAAQAGGTYVPGGWGDLACVLNAALTVVAVVTAPRPAAPEPVAEVRTGWRWVSIPVGCNVAALLVLSVEWSRPGAGLGELCALGCLAASLARTALTLRELRALTEVRRQAHTDELTGLANRRALGERAAAHLAPGRPAGVLLLDLDGFKAVNDGLGHAAGDDLLRTVGARLRGALRPSDVLARLGGDEFAVLLPGADAVLARECAARLHRVLVEPVAVAGRVVRVGASIGLATTLGDGRTIESLLAAADAGMYAAKAGGGGVAADPATLLPLPRDPEGAAAADVVLVPLVDPSGRPAAREARTPEGRPADLTALTRALPLLGLADAAPPVWTTLSPADVAGTRTADSLAAALLRSGVPPESVVCVLPRDLPGPLLPAAADLLAGLRARGLGTAVDGTVLQVLGHAGDGALPADVVRLDLTGGAVPAAAVAHAVALVTALGGRVVAVTDDADPPDVPGCPVLRTAGADRAAPGTRAS